MHGAPDLAPGFTHLPYADPAAPQGGTVVFGEVGSFDSLHPHVLKGRTPWLVGSLTVETLMARSWDEPFTLYGLLAESVETPPDRSWVEFTLRPEARFSDGSPVTVEDVIWSLETLGEQGHPRYRNSWTAISGIVQTGPRSLRIDFSEPNRELPLIMGLRPVVQKAQFADRPFAESGMTPIIGSGPYVIDSAEPGRQITFRRNPDWWGRDLGVNAGVWNFDTVRLEMFRNEDALRAALATGAVSIMPDSDPVRWAEAASLPAVTAGRLILSEIPHGRPTGMAGFVFNTRRPPFDDRRVRLALAMALDWEWIDQRLYRGEMERITSYFGNSGLAHSGPPEGREAGILAPFRNSLPDSALTGAEPLPETDGSGRNRRILRDAARLLDEAGWEVAGDIRQKDGRPLDFEILVASTDHETLGTLWADTLSRLGVTARVRLVDSAQFEARRRDYDYDITWNRWWLSLSPGTEQWLYFGSSGRETPGTRNYMGVASEAVDSAIRALVAAEAREDFVAAARALDRVLTHGVFVVPAGVLPTDRVAHSADVAAPARPALYGFRPEVWHRATGAE